MLTLLYVVKTGFSVNAYKISYAKRVFEFSLSDMEPNYLNDKIGKKRNCLICLKGQFHETFS